MTGPHVVRPVTNGGPLAVHHVADALEKCEAPGCTRPAVWAVNYADEATALPVPTRSCSLHLGEAARVLCLEAAR